MAWRLIALTDELLHSAEARGAAIAVISVLAAAGMSAVVGEWRSGRDDARLRKRERDDRARAMHLRTLAATRKFLAEDFDAMRRHIEWGANVVRPRLADHPRALISLLGDHGVGLHRDLTASVYDSPPGDRDPDRLRAIEAHEGIVASWLNMIEGQMEIDEWAKDRSRRTE